MNNAEGIMVLINRIPVPVNSNTNYLLLSPTYCLEQCKHLLTFVILDEPHFKFPIISYVLLVTVLVILRQGHNISHDLHQLVHMVLNSPDSS